MYKTENSCARSSVCSWEMLSYVMGKTTTTKKNKKNTECFKRLRLGDKKICNLKIDQITNFVLFEKSWIIFNEKLLYILQNCVMNLKKDYFFQHHNFMKKSHSSLSKNEPENIP